MTVDASPDARPRAAGMLRLYRALWARCPGERPWFVAAIVLLFGSQLVKLGVPAVAARAIDVLQQQGAAGLGEAGLWLLALFGATLASWALHGPGRLLERRVALTVRTRESAALVSDVFSLPLAWHEQHHSAATVHRIEQSNRALYDFAQSQFVVLQNAVRLVGPVAALWLIDARVGAAALAGLLVISLSITGFDRAMLRLAREENEAERRHAATLVDAVGHVTTVLALRQTEGVAALIARRLQAIYRPLGRMIVVNEAKWCSVDLLAQGLSCALLALYAVLATRPSAPGAAVPALALGTLYMVWEYALQAGGVISSVAAHFQTFVRQQADHASADPIREAAAARAAPPPAAAPAAGWRRLRIEELGYRYAARSHGLDRVTLTLQRGRRYALVGASGSGKSTLLKLLAGLVAADRIRVVAEPGDAPGATDVDIADPAAAAAWLRSAATLVPQDAEVFEGSLAENLALGRTLAGTAPAGGPAPALRIACADDFVDVAGDLDAVRIAERGGNWSGGQRQRVALARGVLAAERSPLLLLDEPTASLDPQTEERVHERLFAAFGDAAIVASVHRPHLLARFDEVLWMDGGRLVGQMPAARYLAHRGPTGDAPPVA